MKKDSHPTYWYAIRTAKESLTEEALKSAAEETYFPKRITTTMDREHTRAIIPHVIFVKAEKTELLRLERLSHTDHSPLPSRIWVYRYPDSTEIQTIPPEQINILRLLTANDDTRCEIFKKKNFKPGAHVEVTGGPFQGLQGTVQRVKKNRHVIVRIEGICLVMLPFIHPNLLQEVN